MLALTCMLYSKQETIIFAVIEIDICWINGLRIDYWFLYQNVQCLIYFSLFFFVMELEVRRWPQLRSGTTEILHAESQSCLLEA